MPAMIMSEFATVSVWWLIIQVLGWSAWPLAFRWLRWLPDRGYTLAKPLGLLLVSYLFWLIVSLRLLPNSPGTMLAVMAALLLISLWVYQRGQRGESDQRVSIAALWRERRGWFIVYEIIFAAIFIGWCLFRAHAPDILSGEKPMEFGFLNAIGRSAYFPPHDPWLSGESIAYYYFGYVMMSLLHRVSGVSAGAAFSLSNALWFALSAVTAFGVVGNLVLLAARHAQRAAVVFGAIGAIMLAVMGNWEAPLDVAYTARWGTPEFWTWLDVLDLNTQPYVPAAPDRPAWLPRADWEWWWRASRVIHDYPPTSIGPQLSSVTGIPPDPNTDFQEVIAEFPQFSFMFGDMHPHVLNLPFALLAMAVALNLYQAAASGEATALWHGKARVALWPLYPIVLGSAGFLNTWDYPIYLSTAVAAFALGRWQRTRLQLADDMGNLFVVGVLGVLAYAPFYLNFSSQVGGLGPNLFYGTRAAHFLAMFGTFSVILSLFVLKLINEVVRTGQVRALSFGLKILAGGVILTVIAALAVAILTLSITSRGTPRPDVEAGKDDPVFVRFSQSLSDWLQELDEQMIARGITVKDHITARIANPWTPLALASGLTILVLLWKTRRSTALGPISNNGTPTSFILLLIGVGLLLAFSVEFIFIVDLFKTRMNTVFKFYFQVWALWSVASAYGLYYLLQGPARLHARTGRWAVGLLAGVLIGLGLIFPVLALPSRIMEIDSPARTLDAAAAMIDSKLYPNADDDYAVADWFERNVPGAPTILTAADDQFTSRVGRARISAWTGLPTVLGWYGHETQWRGNDRIQRARLPDITMIYSTTDPEVARELLQKYDVSFILVSGRERRQYPAEGLSKFDQMFPIVYENGEIAIYQVK